MLITRFTHINNFLNEFPDLAISLRAKSKDSLQIVFSLFISFFGPKVAALSNGGRWR